LHFRFGTAKIGGGGGSQRAIGPTQCERGIARWADLTRNCRLSVPRPVEFMARCQLWWGGAYWKMPRTGHTN